jgi:hypothetical protein
MRLKVDLLLIVWLKFFLHHLKGAAKWLVLFNRKKLIQLDIK